MEKHVVLNSMEKHEFVLRLSLQQMAMIKVAINVWNEAENLNLLNQVEYENLIFPKKVKEKVSLFVLPEKIKQELLKTLEPVAIQIIKWKDRHATVLDDPGYFIDKLCWTSIGTVDNRKTAQNLIQQEQIDISSRYRLACLYCLENDIPLIWKKLPEDAKAYFSERSGRLGLAGHLYAIWSHKLDHEENKLSGFCRLCNSGRRSNCRNSQYAFEVAVTFANKEAADFFLQKLTPDERKASLLSPTIFNSWVSQCYDEDLYKKIIKFSDIIVYLLSQMNEEQQMELFKWGTLPTVISFLDWPWHLLFKKIAKISFKYFYIGTYEMVLKVLIRGRDICGYYFTKHLEEFLLMSPRHLKNHFRDISFEWTSRFFNSYNSDCINIILRNLGSSYRKKDCFITSIDGRRHCIKLIDEGKWFLLELFIADSALAETDKKRVKDAFVNTLWYDCQPILERHNKGRDWTRFFRLIDNATVEDCNKRNLEDMEAGEWSGKRLK